MRRLYLFIAALSLLLLAACGNGEENAAESAEAASDEKIVKIGATPDGYPQYFMEDGELKGYSVDVIEAIFEKIGYTIEWELADWTGVLASLESGKVDTAANFAATPERGERYNFSEPYYSSKAVIAVGKNNDSIQSVEDLRGKQLASALGTNYENVLKAAYPDEEFNIVNYEASDVILTDVATEKIDGYISGRELLLAQIKDRDIPLKIVGEPFGDQPVALPFAKDEKYDEMIEAVNQAIEELVADGTVSTLSEKWYGIDLLADQ